jgi:hypothetical protein
VPDPFFAEVGPFDKNRQTVGFEPTCQLGGIFTRPKRRDLYYETTRCGSRWFGPGFR